MRLIIGNVQTPANPLLRAVYMLVGAVVLVGSLFFGALVLAFVIGFLIIVAAIAAVRLWWLGRKFEKAAAGAQQRTGSQQRRTAAGGRVIEGEFVEVSETSQSDRHRDD